MKTNVELISTRVYAGRLKDRENLNNSSSGGAFTALSDFFLKNGNAVVAAIYNYENHTTEFQMILDKDQRERAKGSKYMQSKPGCIFREAYRWLMEHSGKKMLFVGMGCQSDGFRKFSEMKGIRDRVYIVDIICHGSPSPKLWREYAESVQKKDGKITFLTFKDKRNGWKSPTAYVKVNGEEKSIKDYVKVFYNRCALRPSCYECPYATTERKTDMTVTERKINTEDLISFEEIAKKHIAGEYLAIGNDGKSYHASYVPKYEPSGVMFFCIPQSVEILGYLEIV